MNTHNFNRFIAANYRIYIFFLDAVKRGLRQLQNSTVLRACKLHPVTAQYGLFVDSGDESDSSYKLLQNRRQWKTLTQMEE